MFKNLIKFFCTKNNIPRTINEAFTDIKRFKNIKELDQNKYFKNPEIIKNFSEKNIPFENNSSFNNLKKINKKYDNLVLNNYLLNKKKMKDNLKNIIINYFNFLNDKNNNLNNINIESNFLKYLIDLKSSSYNNKFNFKINVDDINIEILEINHISGAYVERSQNPFIKNIYLHNNEEINGLLEYKLNKNFDEYINYYLSEIENEVILRLNLLIKWDKDIEIYKNDNLLKKINTNHIITIENQLKKPIEEVFLYKEPIKDILQYYRLGKWYIVDFDGIFNGNHLFLDENQNNYLFNFNN